jgi:hypothetical protein
MSNDELPILNAVPAPEGNIPQRVMLSPSMLPPGMSAMPSMPNIGQGQPSPQQQRPAPIGVELFVQNDPPKDGRPGTIFDAAWTITWTNVPAVLADVSKALAEWGITQPKPIVLRFERSKINPDIVAMLMDYIVLNVRNAGLESVIEVAVKPADSERLPDGVGSN